MRPVLFAWELGENLGHAMPLSRMAAALQADGLQIVVCARSLLSARIAFNGIEATILQAPVWPHYRYGGVLSGGGNYANILNTIGFHEPRNLAAVVAGWISLIDLVKPSVAVSDHSPAFLIAARIRNLPVIATGTPYTMPPLEGPNLPPVDALVSPVADERRMVASAAAVLSQWGKPVVETLPRLLATESRFVFGLPEIDPYAAVRREQLFETPEGLPKFAPVPAEPSIFAYYGANDPNAEALFQALAETGVKVSCYLRGESGLLSGFLQRRGVVVYETPQPLAEVLPKVSHVLSGGGAHVTQAAMAAGRPHLIMPRHEEAAINARHAARLNVGRWLDAPGDRAKLRAAITTALAEHSMHTDAARLAATIGLRPRRPALEMLKATIKRHVR